MPINYGKYPPNWKKEIRPRILKRADNKCEKCGVKNGQKVSTLKLYLHTHGKGSIKTLWFRNRKDAIRHQHLGILGIVKVILTVAHLDHDEQNWSVTDDRLMAMCQYCHLNYDSEEKKRRKDMNT